MSELTGIGVAFALAISVMAATAPEISNILSGSTTTVSTAAGEANTALNNALIPAPAN